MCWRENITAPIRVILVGLEKKKTWVRGQQVQKDLDIMLICSKVTGEAKNTNLLSEIQLLKGYKGLIKCLFSGLIRHKTLTSLLIGNKVTHTRKLSGCVDATMIYKIRNIPNVTEQISKIKTTIHKI